MVLPWFDEVFQVELGRLFLSGFDADNMLLGVNGGCRTTLYYLGPCIQELFLRLFGSDVARCLPLAAIVIVWLAFRKWLLKCGEMPKPAVELFALVAATSTLLFQSAFLSRIDAYALATFFSAMAVLGPPCVNRSLIRLSLGSILTVASVFCWPSALMAVPIVPLCCFSRKNIREFGIFAGACLFSLLVLMLPIASEISSAFSGFANHSKSAMTSSFSCLSVCDAFAREILRSPFLMILAGIGLYFSVRDHRYSKLAAFLLGLFIGISAGLYSMRFVYLLPIIFLLGADAVCGMLVSRPRRSIVFLSVALVYGFVAGPIGQCFLDKPLLPENAKSRLAELVGEGPTRVFVPDHTAYYIGRELGWKQLAFAHPPDIENEDFLRKTLSRCDAIVIRDFGRYESVQYCCSPFGIISRYLLGTARAEANLPECEKSLVARIGERYAGQWQHEFDKPGFVEVGRVGVLRIYKRVDGRLLAR